MSHEERSRGIQARFQSAAQTLYEQTHDILPIAGGRDGISKLAFDAFIPAALAALAEDGVVARGSAVPQGADYEQLARFIVAKMTFACRDQHELREAFLTQAFHYTDALAHHLERQATAQTARRADRPQLLFDAVIELPPSFPR